jgi:hypothetical protein
MDEPIAVAGSLCCLVSIVLIAAVTVAQRRRERREHERWRQWADRHGWTFTSRPSVAWRRQVPGEVRAAVSGIVQGRRVTVAECAETDGEANTTYFVAAVVALRRPLPDTAVEPRGAVSRLLGTGAKTGRADFDRAFRIRGTDPQWLPAALVEAHLTGTVPASWSVHGTDLITVRRGRLAPDQVHRIAAEVQPLAELLEPSGPGAPGRG